MIACDFDGTITEHDTLHLLVDRFGDAGVWRHLHPELMAGRITVENAMEKEISTLRVYRETALAEVRRSAGLRAGFGELVAFARDGGHRLYVLSNGFRTLIEDFLHHAGHGHLPVHSHDCAFDGDSVSISWAARGETCELCGRPCKRHDLSGLRGDDTVVYIGDGLSDRCVAQAADVIYARAGLAEYLTEIGVPFRPFDDFHQITDDLTRMADAA